MLLVKDDWSLLWGMTSSPHSQLRHCIKISWRSQAQRDKSYLCWWHTTIDHRQQIQKLRIRHLGEGLCFPRWNFVTDTMSPWCQTSLEGEVVCTLSATCNRPETNVHLLGKPCENIYYLKGCDVFLSALWARPWPGNTVPWREVLSTERLGRLLSNRTGEGGKWTTRDSKGSTRGVFFLEWVENVWRSSRGGNPQDTEKAVDRRVSIFCHWPFILSFYWPSPVGPRRKATKSLCNLRVTVQRLKKIPSLLILTWDPLNIFYYACQAPIVSTIFE